MKTKTSITLSRTLLASMDRYAADFKSRSEMIEVAVERFPAQLARDRAHQKDMEILNRRAKVLNAEAEDVLSYQVPL